MKNETLFLKTAETRKLIRKAVENRKTPKRLGKQKKAMESRKSMKISMESRKRIPYNPPLIYKSQEMVTTGKEVLNKGYTQKINTELRAVLWSCSWSFTLQYFKNIPSISAETDSLGLDCSETAKLLIIMFHSGRPAKAVYEWRLCQNISFTADYHFEWSHLLGFPTLASQAVIPTWFELPWKITHYFC